MTALESFTTADTLIADVRQFMTGAGCTTESFNPRQTALYTGLQLEELAEKLAVIAEVSPSPCLRDLVRDLNTFSIEFKQGKHDEAVANADREELLDADIDLTWVSLGSAYSQGADVEGACNEVSGKNLDKLVPCTLYDDTGHFDGETCPQCHGATVYAIKDGNGKIQKPEGWTPPSMAPYVCRDEVAP